MAKKYSINEYFLFSDTNTGVRIEVYSDNTTAGKLFSKHIDSGYTEIKIADCIEDLPELPLPNDIMRQLDQKISLEKNAVIVTGIDTYLFLLNNHNRESFMIALKNRLNTWNKTVIYLISSTFFCANYFKNPKYYDSLMIVYILGENAVPEQSIQESVTVLPSEWANVDIIGWKQLFNKMGKYLPSASYEMALLNSTSIQAGLSDNVISLFNTTDIAEKLYKIPRTLPESCIRALLEECKLRSNYYSFSVLEELFGKENLNTSLVLKRLVELKNDDKWYAYIWYLKKSLDKGTYIYQVINECDLTSEKILRNYIVTSKKILLSENAGRFQEERKKAISELGIYCESLIIEFIQYIKDEPNSIALSWLNCNTKSEHVEIIRRVANENLDYGIPQIIKEVYSALSDYLTSDFDYPEKELNDYFKLYRKQRVTEKISADFVKKALSAIVPPKIEKRDSILNKYKSDSNTALFVVDGMGAEYYPLILSLAQRSDILVEYKSVAEVRLPTSTEYNNIDWNNATIKSVHEIDNISHVGAKKYEGCSYTENMVAIFEEFNRIINVISESLNTYSKVILTADHGSSRLAVIAYENGLSETLTEYKNTEDWRYMSVSGNESECPDVFESYYDADREKTYWIVKGYNRLPKKGGKLCVHGGATLEERLVPVIVFTRDHITEVESMKTIKPVEQLVEKAGFDDI